MTDERKNEIWAMLPPEKKAEYREEFFKPLRTLWDKGYCAALKSIFGTHNLLFKSEYKAGDKVVITGSFCGNRGDVITLVRQYDCPREANDYKKLWVGQFEDGHTCSISEKDFTPTVEFEQAGEKPKEPRFKVGDKVLYKDKELVILNLNQVEGDYRYFVSDNIAKAYWYDEDELDPYTEPKEPKFNIGEKVRINCYSNGEVWDAVMHNRIVTIQDYYVKDGVNMYVLKEGCRDFGEHCLEPYTPASNVASEDAGLDASQDAKISKENGQKPLDVAESVEISTNEDAYFAYRLDLAKEIAVAMIRNTYVADEIVENVATAANLANEIVKRLKETEI